MCFSFPSHTRIKAQQEWMAFKKKKIEIYLPFRENAYDLQVKRMIEIYLNVFDGLRTD